MRALGFYVSDFHGGSEGFSDRDLDRLIERGAIEVVDLPSAGGAANKAAEPENEITTARSGAACRVRSRNSSKATSEGNSTPLHHRSPTRLWERRKQPLVTDDTTSRQRRVESWWSGMSESRKSASRGGFGALFAEAESHVDFWEEEAIIRFTEDVCLAMERAGLSKAELARRLGTSNAYVTKVLRGNANFTLKTMARLAIALDSELRMRLAPRESRTHWFDELAFKGAREYLVENTETTAVGATRKALDENWSIAA